MRQARWLTQHMAQQHRQGYHSLSALQGKTTRIFTKREHQSSKQQVQYLGENRQFQKKGKFCPPLTKVTVIDDRAPLPDSEAMHVHHPNLDHEEH